MIIKTFIHNQDLGKLEKIVYAPIENSYGKSFVAIYNDEYCFGIENYDGVEITGVSANFYETFRLEFIE